MNINRKYKDRLFCSLFGDESRKKNTLELYNALNDTDYDDEKELVLSTLEDVIYMGMKNDVSCIIFSNLSMFEQQSTFNPNMPIRGFMYAGKQFAKYIEENDLNIYGSKMIKLPSPHYYVFYNGDKECDDIVELRLSDAFEGKSDSRNYEWTAIMLNINEGHNEVLLKKCKPLLEYSIFISTVKKYREAEENMETAVEYAINECVEKGVLSEYLLLHKAEVLDMVLTEYNEEKTMKLFAKEYEEIGEERGKQEEKIKIAKKMIEENVDISIICSCTGLTEDEVEKLRSL